MGNTPSWGPRAIPGCSTLVFLSLFCWGVYLKSTDGVFSGWFCTALLLSLAVTVVGAFLLWLEEEVDQERLVRPTARFTETGVPRVDRWKFPQVCTIDELAEVLSRDG